jgi:hypothetical protein
VKFCGIWGLYGLLEIHQRRPNLSTLLQGRRLSSRALPVIVVHLYYLATAVMFCIVSLSHSGNCLILRLFKYCKKLKILVDGLAAARSRWQGCIDCTFY